METLTWYQKRFNESRGYKKNLQKPLKWYINDWIKNHLFRIYIYSNAVNKPYSKRVEIKGPRGGCTGRYTSVTIPATKATYGDYKVKFFPYKWLAFSLGFNWGSEVYRNYSISFNLEKLNWKFAIKIQNNTV